MWKEEIKLVWEDQLCGDRWRAEGERVVAVLEGGKHGGMGRLAGRAGEVGSGAQRQRRR